MPSQKVLELREIRVHPVLLEDDYLFTNPKTGEVYHQNRAKRREELSMIGKISKHEAQQRPAQDWRERRRARSRMSKASRRRNWRA